MDPRRSTRRRRSSGFTLIEMIIVMLFIAIMMAIGVPALQQMIHRSRLEGAARECAMMCQRARLESIKAGVPVVVRFDTTDRRVESWLDANGDGVQDADETELAVVGLPGAVRFAAPEGDAVTFNKDDDGGQVVFFTDGSIDEEGAVHFLDERGNYLRLELSPTATGNVEITKYDPDGIDDDTKWLVPGENGKPWEWN